MPSLFLSRQKGSHAHGMVHLLREGHHQQWYGWKLPKFLLSKLRWLQCTVVGIKNLKNKKKTTPPNKNHHNHHHHTTAAAPGQQEHRELEVVVVTYTKALVHSDKNFSVCMNQLRETSWPISVLLGWPKFNKVYYNWIIHENLEEKVEFLFFNIQLKTTRFLTTQAFLQFI